MSIFSSAAAEFHNEWCKGHSKAMLRALGLDGVIVHRTDPPRQITAAELLEFLKLNKALHDGPFSE